MPMLGVSSLSVATLSFAVHSDIVSRTVTKPRRRCSRVQRKSQLFLVRLLHVGHQESFRDEWSLPEIALLGQWSPVVNEWPCNFFFCWWKPGSLYPLYISLFILSLRNQSLHLRSHVFGPSSSLHPVLLAPPTVRKQPEPARKLQNRNSVSKLFITL